MLVPLPLHIDGKFLLSDRYKYFIHFLLDFEYPLQFIKNQCRSLQLREMKYFIVNANLYWKDLLNILFSCLTENEIEGAIEQFHEGVCGVHYNWKATQSRIILAKDVCIGWFKSKKLYSLSNFCRKTKAIFSMSYSSFS